MDKRLYVVIIIILLFLTSVNIVPNSLKAEETDTYSPEIISVENNPDTVGFGFNVSISPSITDNMSGVSMVTVNITFPDNSTGNFTMNNTENSTYKYVFSDTWMTGQYNYTIWTIDNANNTNISSQCSFNVSANAVISVATLKDTYDEDEFINLTDPPGGGSSSGIDYELLDDGKVLHIWNNYDDYYFNTSNGLQITNHYDEYWSHNVLMLGYYNNDEWNLIYRVDELSGFNKNIVSDNETFVNVTLWKDLSYGGYDFRLAIRYCLGVDDNELTVIPYIKNLGVEIPFNLGFAWELKDIQVDMTPGGDFIEINGTSYFLNDTLDETYNNLTDPCFYIREDVSNYSSESLYLCWDENLNYIVKVKSRDGQYNAPVTLGVKIGSLGVGQEKYTSLFWHDAFEVVYYFNSHSGFFGDNWMTNPGYMVDGNISTFASTSVDGDVELLNGNTCKGKDSGVIGKVELRCRGYNSGSGGPGSVKNIILRPVFSGGDGDDHVFDTGSSAVWSSWYNITGDTNAPEKWKWNDVLELCCDVESDLTGGIILYCSKVEIKVTYNINDIYDPVPVSGSKGVGLVPLLSISVDAGEETMDISWLSNCSGDWQVFGVNDSVSSGTYSQVFSNATSNSFWWYWKVNVSLENGYEESDVFSFFTGYESKIMNTGSTNLSGFLNIQLQYYHEAVDDWLFVKNVINEDTPRYINAGEYLALDTIFNGLVNSTSDLYFWNGTYRVYVALKGPNGKVLKSDDETLIQECYEFNFTRKNMHGWRKLMGGGFNRTSNIGVRGMTIFNGEMYVGTENHNMSLVDNKSIDCNGFIAGTRITMANGSYKNIEDINTGDIVKAYNIDNNSFVNANVTIAYCFTTDVVPDNYVVINGNLKVSPYHLIYVNDTLMNASVVGVGDTLVDVNGSNVTVTSSSDVSMKKELYNFEISVDPEIEPLFTPNNLTYFAEDLQVYPWGDDDVSVCCFDILNWFWNIVSHRIPNFICDWITKKGCEISEGCDIWKYNFTNDKWTEVIGPNTIPSSGFNDTNNAGGDIAVFNNSLYFAAGNYNGVEIWRYNGSTWEQVVGPIAPERDSGFDDPENEIVLAMKVFTNETNVTHLYAGTVNYNWSDTGFCQIWRTTNGVNWEKVVDKGFRDNVTIPGGFYGVKNAYCWDIEIFQDKLYAGTFNIPVGYNNMGCQLWRSASGNEGDWEKVNLPDGNNTGQYMDGFGEPNPNYGIRRLVNWSNNLYVGIATSFLKLPDFGGKNYSCELWKYNGGNDWSDWECIVGDDSINNGTEWKDGFGDYFNKYLWSLTECNDSLWAGTISVQIFNSTKLPLFIGREIWEIIDNLFDTTGCEVWRYNGTDLIPIVNDIEGSEIGSGFGDPNTFIARYSIEYPEGSGHIAFGTVQADMIVPEPERRGCSVWMRYD